MATWGYRIFEIYRAGKLYIMRETKRPKLKEAKGLSIPNEGVDPFIV